MKKLAFAVAAIVAVASVSGAALGQGRDGARGGHDGGAVRGHAGGAWHGGGWHGSQGGWYGPRVGVYLGGPYWWGGWGYPYYAPYPGYYPYSVYAPYPADYPYSAYVPDDPPAYAQSAPAAAPAPPVYWYYCPDPAGYFPYVQNCSKAWMTVVPPRGPTAPNSVAPTQ